MPGWEPLAASQDGVIARRQLLAAGLTPAGARTQLDAGRWRPLLPGIYLTHTGPADERARIWAGVLYCGPGAMAGAGTALWLAAAIDESPSLVSIVVPAHRRVTRQPGLRIRYSRLLPQEAHPSACPPRLRLEAAVLDVVDRTTSAQVVLDLVMRVTQRRLTTAARLGTALRGRRRQRWRSLLNELLADVAAGAASPLEHRYLNDVERAHRLPHGERNLPEYVDGATSSRYRDVRYRPWGVVVELDGREAHPGTEAFRDMRRDNGAVTVGEVVLRYGWRDVAGDPCSVAAQVGEVLHRYGWGGVPARCGPHCAVRRVA